MSIARIIITALVGAGLAAVGWMAVQRLLPAGTTDVLYGNVEIRQVDLAFNAEGTVTRMAKREGDAVMPGEVIAELDAATYRHLVSLAEGRRDAAAAALAVLLAGTRKEELEQARANLAYAQAQLAHDDATLRRQAELVRTDAASHQAVDDARMAADAARARTAQLQAAVDEAVAGPRQQDIDAARAQLRAADASVDLAREQLSHARLSAPAAGVIITRVIEPGTVVLPTSTVYSMAITNEVWVRGFAPEPMLCRVSPGTAVSITSDEPGGRSYHGRVGYVSPVAEFTPKTVETPELRTQLVYRLRVRVEDPDAGVRQGMPVTIHLPQRS